MMKYEIKMSTKYDDAEYPFNNEAEGYEMTSANPGFGCNYTHKTYKNKEVYHDSSHGMIYRIETYGPFFAKESVENKMVELINGSHLKFIPYVIDKYGIQVYCTDEYWNNGDTLIQAVEVDLGPEDIMYIPWVIPAIFIKVWKGSKYLWSKITGGGMR